VPTYEYACSSCGTHVEVFQRFNDEPLTKCGVCGGALRKVFHPAGILFKGSGFYATDSRTSRTKDAGARGGEGQEAKPTAAKADSKKTSSEKTSSEKTSSEKTSKEPSKERSA
jgi:putative FmdB family regulatory protein